MISWLVSIHQSLPWMHPSQSGHGANAIMLFTSLNTCGGSSTTIKSKLGSKASVYDEVCPFLQHHFSECPSSQPTVNNVTASGSFQYFIIPKLVHAPSLPDMPVSSIVLLCHWHIFKDLIQASTSFMKSFTRLPPPLPLWSNAQGDTTSSCVVF